jgi:hypothetical protein
LRGDGIIVANITNHYLDLAPVIQAVARYNGLEITRIHTMPDPDKLIYYSEYMVVTKDKAFIAANPPTTPLYAKPIWTDRYSNLFQVLILGDEE